MGLLDAIGGALGTTNTEKPTPYKVDPNAYQWGGPSQGTLGGYLGQQQGQSYQDYSQAQGARGQQQGYLGMLQNAANGNGPSAAQGMLQQAQGRAAAQSTSLARSGGGNAAQQAASMRAGLQQGAAGMTDAGAQAAQLRAQEQQAAMGQMGGALQGMRAQDLQSMGMGNQMANSYLGAQMQQGGAQLDANMQRQQQQSQNYNAAIGDRANINNANAQQNSSLLSGIGGAAAGALALSDVRAKQDIHSAGERPGGHTEADSFLSTLHPYSYEYRDEGDAPSGGGRYLGVMAQDLERAPTGHTMVTETPRGKAIEGPAAMSGALAGLGRLHERVSHLEEIARTMRGGKAA